MRTHPVTVLWLMLFVVAVVGIGAPVYAQFFYSSHPIAWLSALPDIHGKEWFPFGAIIAALTTLLAGAIINLRIAVKKHTIDILLSTRNSAVAQQKNTEFTATYRTLPRYVPIAPGDWNIEQNQSAIKASTYLLNYFEFIAIAIRERDLDERLMRESLEQIVATLTWMCAAWIDQQAALSPQAWENLRWLHKRWKLHKYDDMLAGTEKLGLRKRLKRFLDGRKPAPMVRVAPTIAADAEVPPNSVAPTEPTGDTRSAAADAPAAGIESAQPAARKAHPATANSTASASKLPDAPGSP